MEERVVRLASQGPRRRRRGRRRDRHLERSPDERGSPQSLQPPERELEPDEEEDERNAELGDRLDAPRLADPAESVRADDDAGDEEADDLRQLQPTADPEDGKRRRKDDDEIPEKRPLPHGASIGRPLSESREGAMTFTKTFRRSGLATLAGVLLAAAGVSSPAGR